MMRKIDHFIEKNHTVLEHNLHNQSLHICTPIFLLINKVAFVLHVEMMNAREYGNFIDCIDFIIIIILKIDIFKLRDTLPLVNESKCYKNELPNLLLEEV